MQLVQHYLGNFELFMQYSSNSVKHSISLSLSPSMTSPVEEHMTDSSSLVVNTTPDENDDDGIMDDPMSDPLSDPLALDDILTNTDSNSIVDGNPVTEIPEIILVDVTSLTKCKSWTAGGNGTNKSWNYNFQFLAEIPAVINTTICVSETEADDSYETPTIDVCETGEEGVRSDGSDSGLGSEPSTTLPTVSLRPINCTPHFSYIIECCSSNCNAPFFA